MNGQNVDTHHIEMAFEHIVKKYVCDWVRADNFSYVENPIPGQERENIINLGRIIAWLDAALYNLGKELKDKSPEKYRIVKSHRNNIWFSNDLSPITKALRDLLEKNIID